jgi:hypothetical protein
MQTIFSACAADLGRNTSQDRLTAFESTKSVNLLFNQIVRLRLCRQVIPLVAGVDRHSDCFLDLGDFMTSNPFKNQDVWLMPHLRFKMSGGHRVATGTLIGNYARSLIPSWQPPTQQRSMFTPQVPCNLTINTEQPFLTSTPCTFRIKCVKTLTMPVRIPGHDLQSMTGCAFFAYADLNEAATMPGASVLAGWPAPPWGQIAMGPAPPSLQAVKVCTCRVHRIQFFLKSVCVFLSILTFVQNRCWEWTTTL